MYLVDDIIIYTQLHITASGHTKLISCFWFYKSLKMVRSPGLVEGKVLGQDYKMQTIVYLKEPSLDGETMH